MLNWLYKYRVKNRDSLTDTCFEKFRSTPFLSGFTMYLQGLKSDLVFTKKFTDTCSVEGGGVHLKFVTCKDSFMVCTMVWIHEKNRLTRNDTKCSTKILVSLVSQKFYKTQAATYRKTNFNSVFAWLNFLILAIRWSIHTKKTVYSSYYYYLKKFTIRTKYNKNMSKFIQAELRKLLNSLLKKV
jgi:hypothetical protein